MNARPAILALLLRTLGELLLLPCHVLWFVVRRRRIRAEIRAVLEHARAAAADPSPRRAQG